MTDPRVSPNLGRSGLRVSTIGLGCNNFGRPGPKTETQEGTAAVIPCRHRRGHHPVRHRRYLRVRQYGRSEKHDGQGAPRVVAIRSCLASKFGHADYESPLTNWAAKGSRRYVRQAVEGSLRRLQTDWIDLYQLHTPDPLTPIEETLDVLDDLIREGKVRYIGHSNLAGWQIADAELTAPQLHGHPRFVSAQNEYSLLVPRRGTGSAAGRERRYGLGFLPYFPLYKPDCSPGKFSRSGGPRDSRIMRQRPHLLQNAPVGRDRAVSGVPRGAWGEHARGPPSAGCWRSRA